MPYACSRVVYGSSQAWGWELSNPLVVANAPYSLAILLDLGRLVQNRRETEVRDGRG